MHISPINISFLAIQFFPSLQKYDIASFDARKIYFRLLVISSQARRVKILRNFCVKKSRIYLARHGEKNSRVLWQRCGMASRSIRLYLRLVSTWRPGRRYRHRENRFAVGFNRFRYQLPLGEFKKATRDYLVPGHSPSHT